MCARPVCCGCLVGCTRRPHTCKYIHCIRVVVAVCLYVCLCPLVGSKSTNEDVPAVETSIPSHLDHMLHLLCEEDEEADEGMVRTCACGHGGLVAVSGCLPLPV